MKIIKKKDAKQLIMEMNDDLSKRLRDHHLKTSQLALAIRFTYSEGGGFSHQIKLDYPTDDTKFIYKELIKIFDKYIENHLTRGIYISYGKLSESEYSQLSLFEDSEEQIKEATFKKQLMK